METEWDNNHRNFLQCLQGNLVGKSHTDRYQNLLIQHKLAQRFGKFHHQSNISKAGKILIEIVGNFPPQKVYNQNTSIINTLLLL